ncbi:C2 domain protein [Cooperia oncophora]
MIGFLPLFKALTKRSKKRRKVSADNDHGLFFFILEVYAKVLPLIDSNSAVHIERASRETENTNTKKMNGDSVPVEPAKTVNPSPGKLEPEIKMNVEDISMLRSDSVNSINTTSGRSSRLGRVFHAKHAKSVKHRGNQPRGEVEMSIRYSDALRKLVVQVLGAQNLLPWEKDGQCNPYATAKVISIENNKEVSKRKTAVVKNTLNPRFDNHFEFDMEAQDIHNYKLQITVKDDTNYGAFTPKPVLGQIDIRLATLPSCQLLQQWVRLEAERT